MAPPQPIVYEPMADPYGYLRAGIDRPLNGLRARDDQRYLWTAPQLRTMFHQLNRDVFDGTLPEPRLVIEPTSRSSVAGECLYRSWQWNEPFRVSIRPDMADDIRRAKAVFRHELAHVAQMALHGRAGKDEDDHGPIFREQLERIDQATDYEFRGVISGVGEPRATRPNLAAAKPDPSRSSTTRSEGSAGQITMRRGDAGEVVSRVTATFTRKTRTGHQNLHVMRGQKVESDHWAVSYSPQSFGQAPA